MIERIKSTIKNHGQNIFWSNFVYFIESFEGLILSIMFARFASKELYGDYLFILSIFSLLSFISIPGTNTVILKSVARGFDGVYKKATSLSFKYGLLAIPFLFAIGILFMQNEKVYVGRTILLTMVFFPFFISLKTWIPLLKGKGKFKKLSCYSLILSFVNIFTISVVLIKTESLLLTSLTYFFLQSIFNILYYVRVSKLYLNEKIEKNWKKQSFSLTISNISGIIFGKADIFFMGMLLSSDKIAIYGLTMKLGGVFFKLIKGTFEAVLPKIYKSEKLNISSFYKIFLVSFLFPLLIIPFVKYPILFLYGEDFNDVIFLSQIYLLAIPFYLFYTISLSFLIKENLNKEINASRIYAMITVLVSYFILIPTLGALGGVLSSIIFFAFQSVYNFFVLNKNSKINDHKFSPS